jgi:DNA-binding FadR family transcriptional regulator
MLSQTAATAVISQQALVGLESGEFPPGRKIPSERDIVQETGVARSTARRAIALLRKEGVIFTLRDAGRTRQRATQAIGKPRPIVTPPATNARGRLSAATGTAERTGRSRCRLRQ